MGFNADSVLRKLFWGGKGFRKTSADFSPARRRGLGRNAGGPFVSDFLGFQKLKKHDKITIIMELVQDFKKISKKDVSLAGGKGASLGEMTGAGISVPPGFVILSSVFEKFLEETDLNVEIDSVLDSVNHKEMHTIENASEKIQALILQAKMPQNIAIEIEKFFKNLNSKYVAVRSSATAEDSASAAWAGQLESYLNTTEKNLLENVKKCWASLFTPRAIFYRFEKDLHKQKISVAVVVQKMVESEKSGIAFSVHPVTQDRNQLIIEAGFGLGEAIVSGQITPDSYVVGKEPRRIIDKNVQTQSKGFYRAKNGGNEWLEIPKEKGEKQVLTDEEILELSELILDIENHYGFPCDIEWAFENGRFYITQSRPITTLDFKDIRDEIIEEFAKTKWHFIHKRTRSPLYTSLLWEGVHFKTKTNIPFDHSVEKVIYRDAELAIDELSWEKLRERVINFTKNNPEVLSALLRDNYKINDEVEKFALKTQKQTWSSKNLHNFWVKYRNLMHRFGAYVILPLFIEADLEKELKSAVIEKYNTRAEEIYQILTTPIKSGATQEEELSLLKLAMLKNSNKLKNEDIDIYLEKFSWIANNAFDGKFMTKEVLEERIKLASENKPEMHFNSYAGKIENHKQVFEKYYKDFSNNLRIQGVINVLQESIFFRSWRTERYYRNAYFMRDVFAKTADLLNLKNNDIFYLTINEIIESLKNNTLPADIVISERKISYVCFAINNKVFVYSGEKAKLAKQKIQVQEISKNTEEIKGQTAYPGRVNGIVSTVISKDDLKNVKDGSILVSPSTTIDYVPILKKVIAIVTEEGGVLSHASVISRELHIPCVIGTKNATQVLKDGDLVEVDANSGMVKIIERAK